MAHTLYPALIAAMTGYALWAPTWDVTARLGLPATATPAVLTLGGIALFYSLIAGRSRCGRIAATGGAPTTTSAPTRFIYS